MSFDYKRWKEQQLSVANDTTGPDSPMPVEANGCPTVIFLTGLIWGAIGFFLLLMALFYFLQTRDNLLFCLIPWGLMFLFFGVKTLSGTFTGTIRAGCVSIFFGLLCVGVTVVSMEDAMRAMANKTRPYAPLLCLGVGLFGAAFLLSGALGILYSETYLRWRDPYGYRRG